MEIKDNKKRGKHQTTPHYKASIAQKGRDKKQFKVLGTQINKLGLKANSLLCISPFYTATALVEMCSQNQAKQVDY